MDPVFLTILRNGNSSADRTYLYHICQNHPFINGNKRVGANAAITFLLMNAWEPVFQEEELVPSAVSIATGLMAKRELANFSERRSCEFPAADSSNC